MSKYKVGTELITIYGDIEGVVVENAKLPEDIMVQWEFEIQPLPYDEWWLDENVEILNKTKEQ